MAIMQKITVSTDLVELLDIAETDSSWHLYRLDQLITRHVMAWNKY